MLETVEEWVGTGCGDCCCVGRSTLAKLGKIVADVSTIDPSVKARKPVLGTPSSGRLMRWNYSSHKQGGGRNDRVTEG